MNSCNLLVLSVYLFTLWGGGVVVQAGIMLLEEGINIYSLCYHTGVKIWNKPLQKQD